MKRAVIIVAGGKGLRMGMSTPKQFLELDGIPILCRTVHQFRSFDPGIEVILVLPEAFVEFWKKLSQPFLRPDSYRYVYGGAERFHSVKNAVDTLAPDVDIVGVHDGVRPLVSVACIAQCYTQAALKGNAVPCINPPESIRTVTADGTSKIVDRNTVKLIQTPQVFHAEVLRKAYMQPYTPMFTDDASVVEQYGETINLIEGEKSNIKITTFDDINYAQFMVSRSKNTK